MPSSCFCLYILYLVCVLFDIVIPTFLHLNEMFSLTLCTYSTIYFPPYIPKFVVYVYVYIYFLAMAIYKLYLSYLNVYVSIVYKLVYTLYVYSLCFWIMLFTLLMLQHCMVGN